MKYPGYKLATITNLLSTVIFFSFLLCGNAFGQKYNFINYSVENGLLQSQVTCIIQDNDNELWIGTNGGLSRFDGSSFVNYEKSKGLISNFITSLACDTTGNIWIGTTKGLVKYDGLRFHNYFPLGKDQQNLILKVVADRQNNIWVWANDLALYRLQNNRFVKQQNTDTVFDMTLNTSSDLMLATRTGIQYRANNRWDTLPAASPKGEKVIVVKLLQDNRDNSILCYTNKGLYQLNDGKLVPFNITFPKTNAGGMINTSLFTDSRGDIWMNLNDGGVWQWHDKQWKHFTYKNGLTDDAVTSFYEDREGNVWIGTDGAGLYRYGGSYFTYYDRSNGLMSPSITSIAQSRKNNKVYFTTHDHELYTFNGNGEPEKIKISNNNAEISNLVADSKGAIWMDIVGKGIGSYDGSSLHILPSKNNAASRLPISSVLGISGQSIWVWKPIKGLLQVENNTIQPVPLKLNGASCLVNIGKDSLLIGSLYNIFLYHTATHQFDTLYRSVNAVCAAADNEKIFVGTDDRGLLYWDKQRHKLHNISMNDGLSSNFIYNILIENGNNIWLGTGRGIDRITFTGATFSIRHFGKSDGLTGVESNTNASLKDNEGFLWFGTTQGLYRFDPKLISSSRYQPVVVIQSVKLFSKDIPANIADSIIPYENIPYDPHFAPGQNHITFTFKGIYLSNPEKVKYRYRLIGSEKNYTETQQNSIVFSSLPPGDYVFKVWASDADGHWYSNAASYPFTIKAPFYQTLWFRISAALFLIGILLLIVYLRNRQKAKRIAWEQRLREEEQERVRQKTAEDFHDEIGNKITRINLLTTVAQKKLQGDDKDDIKSLLAQIKQNAGLLYNGSKDIIWSLQPQSDFLDEILLRMQQAANDLIQGTSLNFHYRSVNAENLDMHRKLPIDNSRNLMMIFKEIINNTAKHAGASDIYFTATMSAAGLMLEWRDDGNGFDTKTESAGNGMNNIRNRAKRIGAYLNLKSDIGSGTLITLVLPWDAKRGQKM